jgi:hypothetical protein
VRLVFVAIAGAISDSATPMTGHPHRRTDMNMTTEERHSYVRWWIERSGLTPTQVREIANGIWSDRLLDVPQTTVALGGVVFRSATGSEASDVAGDP